MKIICHRILKSSQQLSDYTTGILKESDKEKGFAVPAAGTQNLFLKILIFFLKQHRLMHVLVHSFAVVMLYSQALPLLTFLNFVPDFLQLRWKRGSWRIHPVPSHAKVVQHSPRLPFRRTFLSAYLLYEKHR